MHEDFFYIDPSKVQQEELIFQLEEFHHMIHVIRKKKGDRIRAVDGQGIAYEAEITAVFPLEARAKVLDIRRRVGEPNVDVTLIQSVLKGSRFEWVIEKATELGVRRIIPMLSDRSVANAPPAKMIRWNRLALSAMKQCGRSVKPEIAPPADLDKLVVLGTDCDYRLIAHPAEDSLPLRKVVSIPDRKTVKAILIVGPEGGFTDAEVSMAKEQGFQAIHLGPRRLRGETAGIVFLSHLMASLGELE